MQISALCYTFFSNKIKNFLLDVLEFQCYDRRHHVEQGRAVPTHSVETRECILPQNERCTETLLFRRRGCSSSNFRFTDNVKYVDIFTDDYQ